MSFFRVSHNAGFRCPGHDYYSRCIYHIVLNKAKGIPDFSEITGEPGSHDNPPFARQSRIGALIASALSSLKAHYPFTSILRKCIMPDHVHFAIFIKEHTDIHLGTIIATLKKETSMLAEQIGYPQETHFFEENYHDTFLCTKGQLPSMLAYISDNPRRHLVRSQNKGWFRKFRITGPGGIFDAYGNWDLLSEFQKSPVKVSRKYTEAEYHEWKRRWYLTVKNDGILVSPFIHPKEKRVRDWAIKEKAPLIYLTYKEFPERYKPSGVMFEACSEGRLLIVSVPALNEEHLYLDQHKRPSYNHCQRMNKIAVSIAQDPYLPL